MRTATSADLQQQHPHSGEHDESHPGGIDLTRATDRSGVTHPVGRRKRPGLRWLIFQSDVGIP
jgi:hypothetical protein